MPIWIIWKNIEDYLCPKSIIVAELGGVGQTLSDGPVDPGAPLLIFLLWPTVDNNTPERR
jgi:hypothetical protein